MRSASLNVAAVVGALLVSALELEAQLPTVEDPSGAVHRAAMVALGHLDDEGALPRNWVLSDFEIAPGQGLFEGTVGYRVKALGSAVAVSLVTCDEEAPCRPADRSEPPVAVRLIEVTDEGVVLGFLVPEVPTSETVRSLEVTTYRVAVSTAAAGPARVEVLSVGYIRAAPIRP
jgi:hypothetical protein